MDQPMNADGAGNRTRPTTDPAMSFGALLRRLRVLAGLTQEQLADRAGLSARAVGDLERDGARRPRLDTAALLAEALGLEEGARRAFLSAARPEVAAPEMTGPAATAADSDAAVASGTLVPATTSGAAAPASATPALFEPPTSLLGREREEAALLHLLAQSRLLTLTGPGGVGKTRLALRVAALARERYEAVHVVALAAVREATLVLPTIAAALEVPERTAGTLGEAIAAALGRTPTLLVLDNLEQVLAAGKEIGALLAACPELTVLTTSRAPLRIRGEQEFSVEPLALPPEGAEGEAIAQSTAVQLFVQSARGVRAAFALDEQAGPLVGTICRRLDGLPLAIELAAARTRMLPLGALLDRLERRLEVLRAGPRDLPERQQTMRATIAWSYELLEETDGRLFRRLGVFAGGAGLEAIAVVEDEESNLVIEERLERLAEHSLVTVEMGADGASRARLLETIREYAWEQAEESGEAEHLRQAHAHYYLGLAEVADPQWDGAEQSLWLERLEREHDNLRAALAWGVATGQAGFSLRLAVAMAPFWYVRGHLVDGRRWMEAALAMDVGSEVMDDAGGGLSFGAARAKLLRRAGGTAIRQGDHEGAMAFGAASVALCEQMDDQHGVAAALIVLGEVAFERGDRKEAVALWERSRDLFRALHDEYGLAITLENLGNVALEEGDLARAGALIEESITYERRMGNTRGIAISLHNMGRLALLQGDSGRARELLGQSLTLLGSGGDRTLIADNLEYLGQALVWQGRHARAAVLFGAAEALRAAIGAPRPLTEQASYEVAVTATRSVLGLDHATAWAVGRALPLEQATAEAIADLP
jgi:predicted ATPase/DNA-binding XRE family transcriptional regulator